MFQNVSKDYTEDNKEINIKNNKSIKDILKNNISFILQLIMLKLS